jgi:hypothetical protein
MGKFDYKKYYKPEELLKKGISETDTGMQSILRGLGRYIW